MQDETKPRSAKARQSYSHAKADAKKYQRRLDAEDRQIKHESLTIKERIAKATSRGGSKRELSRLTALLQKEITESPNPKKDRKTAVA